MTTFVFIYKSNFKLVWNKACHYAWCFKQLEKKYIFYFYMLSHRHTHIASLITLQSLQNYELECPQPNKLFLTYVNALSETISDL